MLNDVIWKCHFETFLYLVVKVEKKLLYTELGLLGYFQEKKKQKQKRNVHSHSNPNSMCYNTALRINCFGGKNYQAKTIFKRRLAWAK